MEFIFFDMADNVLFSRSDAEEAHWIQQEMRVTAIFPFDSTKVITRGMRVGFRDPATDSFEVFEVRNIRNVEPDHYQQITAESIAVAELSDEHIDSTEITDKTPQQALTSALSGVSYWNIGNVSATNTSSCDFGRGSVWQAIKTIEQNWNVYCVPRVTVDASGITGKYVDIIPSGGTFRGVRLSIHKNMSDATVTYDDTDVLTALYGYGGTVDVAQSSGDDERQELTFASQVWTATANHPAKPAGQTFLEWPEKTTLYGRNGRPRFGYYQNGNITSASTLLQKTWEQLQETCKPKISISGTVSDLYRLGYKDEPLRLHDTAVVEIKETGELFDLEIIMLDVDLLDPTNTAPEIGDYISNIIYISRETEQVATTGGRSGGGGGRGQSNSEYEDIKTFAEFEKTDSLIGMVVGTKDGEEYIKAGEIALSINETDGTSTALIDADHVNISATSTVHTLAGDIEHDADGKLIIKSAGGMYVQRTESGTTAQFGVWDDGNLDGGVMITQINGETTLKLNAARVDLGAYATVTRLEATELAVSNLVSGVTKATLINTTNITADQATIASLSVSNTPITMGGVSGCGMFSFKVDNVEKAKFLGTADVNFDRAAAKAEGAAAVVVTLDTGSWTAVDSSTGDYRRTVTAKKNGVSAATDTISAQQIWNLGWNACRAWVLDHAHTVLSGYSSWNSGNAAALYVAPTGGAQMATGQTQKWRYGGTVTTYYSAPASK